MLALKLCGGAFVMLAGYVCANVLNRAETRKLTQLDGLIALLRFIKVQIECYCVPIGEILRRCDRSLLESCGAVGASSDFFCLVNSLRPVPDDKIMSVLRSFSGELGASYRDEQVKSCDYHIARLCEIRTPLVAETAKRRKMNTTLCLCSAAGVIILLL